jgi:hypothetical protein
MVFWIGKFSIFPDFPHRKRRQISLSLFPSQFSAFVFLDFSGKTETFFEKILLFGGSKCHGQRFSRKSRFTLNQFFPPNRSSTRTQTQALGLTLTKANELENLATATSEVH